MTTNQRSLSLRHPGRLLGALSAGAAVAVVGIGAIPAGTAAAAGVSAGHVHLADAPPPGPARLPDVRPAAVAASYRSTADGWVRLTGSSRGA